MAEKSVFISYRRDWVGSGFARSLQLALKDRGYDVFLDVDQLVAGPWPGQIERELRQREHFLFLLTPGVFEWCADPKAWLRREYELAVEARKPVVPVCGHGFDLESEERSCPAAIRSVLELQAAHVRHESFENDIQVLIERFLERSADKRRQDSGERKAWPPPASLVERSLQVAVQHIPEAKGLQIPSGAPKAQGQPRASSSHPEVPLGRSEVSSLHSSPPLDPDRKLGAEEGKDPAKAASSKSRPRARRLPVLVACLGVVGFISIEFIRRQGWLRAGVENLSGSVRGSSSPSSHEPVSGTVWTSPSGIPFRFVPAGKYRVGSPTSETGRTGNESRHQVQLTRGFWLAETELTQGQWKKLVPLNPSHFSVCGADCPVEQVNWYEAVGFANVLSAQEGLERCYELECTGDLGTKSYECKTVRFVGLECAGYRLPTETEWEVAARSGTATALYTGGITLSADARTALELQGIAWYLGNSGERTQPVGKLIPNAWGLYDMLGNVWEWVWDWAAPYPTELVNDPVGPEVGALRLFRGGAWDSRARLLRAAYRVWHYPDFRNSYLGFRLARGQERRVPSAAPQE